MQLCVLTYNHPHRKTQDLLYRLALSGFKPAVLAIDWVERRNFKSLYQIKPDPLDYTPETICKRLDFEFQRVGEVKDDFLPVKHAVIIIAGAGILPANFVTENIVVNAHCGWLPLVRGLDALKWAIYDNQPIGVTTHIIDAEVDLGKLIDRRKVSLFPNDNLYSIAIRQYEIEINMLVEAVQNKGWEKAVDFKESPGSSHRRMSHIKEMQMIKRLESRLTGLNTAKD